MCGSPVNMAKPVISRDADGSCAHRSRDHRTGDSHRGEARIFATIRFTWLCGNFMLPYSSQKYLSVSKEYFRMNSPRRFLYSRRRRSAKRLLQGCGFGLPVFLHPQTILSMSVSGICREIYHSSGSCFSRVSYGIAILAVSKSSKPETGFFLLTAPRSQKVSSGWKAKSRCRRVAASPSFSSVI